MFAALPSLSPWTQQLANILPLSALIDFLDVPRILHMVELTGTGCAWRWPVTPAGSRVLLSDRTSDSFCCLDGVGPRTPTCLDGRYGDSYPMCNHETIRLYLDTIKPKWIANNHSNIKDESQRYQRLEFIRVDRVPLKQQLHIKDYGHIAATTIGWILLLVILVGSVITRIWFGFAFLVVVPLTGGTVFLLYGGQPRRLRVERGSEYNRLVVTALHMNETNWQVFYGESSVIGSLLNWQLLSKPRLTAGRDALRIALSILILAQWSTVMGAAVTQSWDSYVISFWIFFCIFSNMVMLRTKRSVKFWIEKHAGVKMDRWQAQLSSRRTLLNAIMALNPDTFAIEPNSNQPRLECLYPGALRWIDPILSRGPDRMDWEEASRLAMKELLFAQDHNGMNSSAIPLNGTSQNGETNDWREVYGSRYWCRFIPEGIEMAVQIREQAELTNRFVGRKDV